MEERKEKKPRKTSQTTPVSKVHNKLINEELKIISEDEKDRLESMQNVECISIDLTDENNNNNNNYETKLNQNG